MPGTIPAPVLDADEREFYARIAEELKTDPTAKADPTAAAAWWANVRDAIRRAWGDSNNVRLQAWVLLRPTQAGSYYTSGGVWLTPTVEFTSLHVPNWTAEQAQFRLNGIRAAILGILAEKKVVILPGVGRLDEVCPEPKWQFTPQP